MQARCLFPPLSKQQRYTNDSPSTPDFPSHTGWGVHVDLLGIQLGPQEFPVQDPPRSRVHTGTTHLPSLSCPLGVFAPGPRLPKLSQVW